MHKKPIMLAALLIAVSLPASAQQSPIMGTWKTNQAKTKTPMGTPPTNNTTTYAPSGTNGMKYTSDRVAADGTKSHIEFTANFDGKTYPYKSQGPGAVDRDGVMIKQLNPYNYQVIYKKGGEPVQINYWIVAKDGKSMTTVSTGITTDATTGKPTADPIYVRLVAADKQ